MRKMLLNLPLLLLTSLLGSLALEDLERKAFVFPVASDTAHVILKAKVPHRLTSVTLCMRFCTQLTRDCSLFSYASKENSNELFLSLLKRKSLKVHFGGYEKVFAIPEALNVDPGWKHVCLSWESSTGLVEIWMNGQSLGQKSLAKGHSISPEGYIVLGQDQDSFGGGFDINQSFVGEISDMYLWEHVPCPNDAVLAWFNHALPDYLINWNSLNYNIVGNVVVKPSVCRAP